MFSKSDLKLPSKIGCPQKSDRMYFPSLNLPSNIGCIHPIFDGKMYSKEKAQRQKMVDFGDRQKSSISSKMRKIVIFHVFDVFDVFDVFHVFSLFSKIVKILVSSSF